MHLRLTARLQYYNDKNSNKNSELMGQSILVTKKGSSRSLVRVAINSDHNPDIHSTNDYFIPRDSFKPLICIWSCNLMSITRFFTINSTLFTITIFLDSKNSFYGLLPG